MPLFTPKLSASLCLQPLPSPLPTPHPPKNNNITPHLVITGVHWLQTDDGEKKDTKDTKDKDKDTSGKSDAEPEGGNVGFMDLFKNALKEGMEENKEFKEGMDKLKKQKEELTESMAQSTTHDYIAPFSFHHT